MGGRTHGDLGQVSDADQSSLCSKTSKRVYVCVSTQTFVQSHKPHIVHTVHKRGDTHPRGVLGNTDCPFCVPTVVLSKLTMLPKSKLC